MSWSRRFEDPIPGIITLRDAAGYILTLPKKARELPEWLAAAEAVLMAAEGRGPMLHARVAMLRAIGVEKVVRVRRAKKYRIVQAK